MGAVWLGTDEVLGREVALKQLTPVVAGGEMSSRAAREAQLAARLSHPHIVAVYDLVEEEGDRPWLVMEYVDGTTLSGLVATQGPLSPEAATSVLGPIARALLAAHEAGVIHRDVKPSNILVSSDGRVKLTDFGIARGVGGDMTVTQTGMVTGSPAYLSPEVAAGGTASPASDVWSLGATLYFALTGHPPYEVGDNVLGALYRIVNEEPPRTPLAGPLAPVLEGAMTRDPEQRWTLPQVHAALTGAPLPAAEVPPATKPPADRGDLTAPPGQGTRPMTVLSPRPASPTRGGHAAARSRQRPGPVLVVALVAGLVVVAVLGALLVGLGQDDDPGPTAQGTSPSSTSSPPASSSAPAPQGPTEEGVRTFVDSYLRTAVSDPPTAFAMLTPEFQARSGGLSGYESWWGKVRSIDRIHSVAPQLGEDLGVTYRYSYTLEGGDSRTEEIHLDLVYADGAYLIAGE